MAASSQFTTPLLIRDDGTVSGLERTPFAAQSSAGSFDEAWLQNLLFHHPDTLPREELDPAYKILIPVCRELNTPAGPIDLVYLTPQGRLALVETKLWRNPQARREVVAQVLDYAKELSHWEYEDLERQVITATKGAVKSVYSLVSSNPNALNEGAFVDQVSRNMRTGQFLLLIVGDGIREGTGALTEFLERFGSLQFTFGLIEVAVFDIAGVGRLVQPRVLARTLIVKRTVVAVETTANAIISDADEGGGGGPEQDAKSRELAEFYRSYWAEFLATLRLDDASQPLPKPTTITNLYFPMPPSGATAWVAAYFAQSRKVVGVYLTFVRGPFADLAWNELNAEREVIDRELGFSVEWQDEGDAKYWISTQMAYDDLSSTETKARITEFLQSRVRAFINAFRPRLERLVAKL